MPIRIAPAGRLLSAAAAVCLLGLLLLGTTDVEAADRERKWGFGWDDGLTLRRWLGDWELALSAGPNDYLSKTEERIWDPSDPIDLQGALEVPADDRREEGWVRFQVGHLAATYDDFGLVVFSGLTYNWRDVQNSSTALDYTGLYDSYDWSYFDNNWILELGLRPSWRPVEFLSIEMAYGLRFTWTDRTETKVQSLDGGLNVIRTERASDYRSFSDFGWSGLGSLKFLFWF